MSRPRYSTLPADGQEAGYEVEDGRLARSVRADEAKDLSVVVLERDVGHRHEATELPT
jgi:hypothetical protein